MAFAKVSIEEYLYLLYLNQQILLAQETGNDEESSDETLPNFQIETSLSPKRMLSHTSPRLFKINYV